MDNQRKFRQAADNNTLCNSLLQNISNIECEYENLNSGYDKHSSFCIFNAALVPVEKFSEFIFACSTMTHGAKVQFFFLSTAMQSKFISRSPMFLLSAAVLKPNFRE